MVAVQTTDNSAAIVGGTSRRGTEQRRDRGLMRWDQQWQTGSDIYVSIN
jgi:hypothetical protein